MDLKCLFRPDANLLISCSLLREKILTFVLASALLQFTVTVFFSFYYNILEVSVLTKFNEILLLFAGADPRF